MFQLSFLFFLFVEEDVSKLIGETFPPHSNNICRWSQRWCRLHWPFSREAIHHRIYHSHRHTVKPLRCQYLHISPGSLGPTGFGRSLSPAWQPPSLFLVHHEVLGLLPRWQAVTTLWPPDPCSCFHDGSFEQCPFWHHVPNLRSWSTSSLWGEIRGVSKTDPHIWVHWVWQPPTTCDPAPHQMVITRAHHLRCSFHWPEPDTDRCAGVLLAFQDSLRHKVTSQTNPE